MADHDDVRRIGRELPGAFETTDRFGLALRSGSKGKEKGLAWVWLERYHPRKARVPNPEVLAIRVPDLDEKEALLAAGHPGLFTEAHYDGYPAVLVRLAEVDADLLEELLVDAWRSQAPTAEVRAWEAEHGLA